MKKILILLSIILFISACVNFPGLSGSGGKEGIIFDFIENMPPTTSLYEEQSFKVGLNIANYATIPVKTQVCISDTPGDAFGGIPSSVCEFVEMRKAEEGDKIIPDEKEVYFPTKTGIYSYSNIEGDMTTNIIAEVSYPYETQASAQLCIKTDQNIKTPIACEMSENLKLSYLYDAPIKITSLKKDIFPRSDDEIEVMLNMDIQNSGSGEVLNFKDAYIPLTANKDVLLDYSIELVGLTSDFKCTPLESGKILLKQNRKTLICSATLNKRDLGQEYLTNPLKIRIKYAYKQMKSLGSISLVGREEI